MDLRPYQQEAREAIEREWSGGRKKTLLVLPTGCGKTIVFTTVSEDRVREGDRVLILAHRGELLDQAADKLERTTGLKCSVEKADQTCLGQWYRVTVGSVQSLMRQNRLDKFPNDYFSTIIVDEAHHILTDGYQRVLNHFSEAKVLGVTATPDRSDRRNLGQFFESLAYEYSIVRAIREGYLCKIMAQTVPLKIDMTSVGQQNGDYAIREIATALDPYLEQIAVEMETYCKNRKTIVFLPLIKTSQKFRDILNKHGFNAAEVNGMSDDRAVVLQDFANNKYSVLCNSMLLTEGYDCPDVDCIVCLRPTKVRSLYCQIIGRGTRIHPGKDNLLILDFLWMTQKHDLCRPASIICTDPEIADKMTKNLEESGLPEDIEEAEEKASNDVMADREEALAKQLEAVRHKQGKLVDPIQFEMSINSSDLALYQPTTLSEMAPASEKQMQALEKLGIFPGETDASGNPQILTSGKAQMILDKLGKRRLEGLATPKQIRFLENRGFMHVGEWQFGEANSMISRISMNGWKTPSSIDVSTYVPESLTAGRRLKNKGLQPWEGVF